TVRSNAEGNATLAFRVTAEKHGEVTFNRQSGSQEKFGTLGLFAQSRWQNIAVVKEESTAADEWVNVEVIVRGNRVVVMVNGKQTADAVINELPDAGGITLNAYDPGTVLEIRKIEIKELPPTPAEQWVQLFDGKDLTGWKPAANTPGEWQVVNGEIV